MAQPDPYQVLGVSKTATQDEIKSAYRALAKRFHPDLNPGNKSAEQRFKEINAAYELIGTPENRAKFDRGEFEGGGMGGGERKGPFYYRTQEDPNARYSYSFNMGNMGGEGAGGFDEDLFETIFGKAGRGARSRDARGRDETYSMDIDLKDSVLGAEREITLPGGRRLSVKIPPGVMSGTRLRFAGQGAPGIGKGPSGDAYVEIRVQPSPLFRIEGHDATLDQSVPLDAAVLGGEIRVPTIDGSVLMRVPPGVNSGTRLRLPGKGLFDRATGSRGDQIVVLSIQLPEPMDPGIEKAVRDWKERGRQAA